MIISPGLSDLLIFVRAEVSVKPKRAKTIQCEYPPTFSSSLGLLNLSKWLEIEQSIGTLGTVYTLKTKNVRFSSQKTKILTEVVKDTNQMNDSID